jgi:hypothetical protein
MQRRFRPIREVFEGKWREHLLVVLCPVEWAAALCVF